MNSRPTVLVVEDEPLIRLGAIEFVEQAGCEALEAQNVDQAIGILEGRSDIRIVLTDVDMPGSMDGVRLAHYIRNRWPPIHLIVASGKAIIAEAQLPAGARFFAKPYPEHAIAETISRLLT